MPKIVAMYDANVLYPAPLRDLLMQLAFDEIIQARWTQAIHEEWIRNVIKNRPDLNPERIYAVAQLMNNSVEGALLTGFEPLITKLILPDPNDCHVLAAAIHGKAQIIVTNNIKDFPKQHLEPYELTALTADDFIFELLETNLSEVLDVIKTIQRRLRKPPVTMLEYLITLEELGLTKTVALVRYHHEKT